MHPAPLDQKIIQKYIFDVKFPTESNPVFRTDPSIEENLGNRKNLTFVEKTNLLKNDKNIFLSFFEI